jgi:hypothetical protein
VQCLTKSGEDAIRPLNMKHMLKNLKKVWVHSDEEGRPIMHCPDEFTGVQEKKQTLT